MIMKIQHKATERIVIRMNITESGNTFTCTRRKIMMMVRKMRYILIVVNEGDIESYCNNAKHALQ